MDAFSGPACRDTAGRHDGSVDRFWADARKLKGPRMLSRRGSDRALETLNHCWDYRDAPIVRSVPFRSIQSMSTRATSTACSISGFSRREPGTIPPLQGGHISALNAS